MGVTEDEIRSLLFIDLLPYDLCIETEAGYKVVIPKGATIPCRRSVEVSLSEENQKELLINVYRKKAKDGKSDESKPQPKSDTKTKATESESESESESKSKSESEESSDGLKVSTLPLLSF